MRSNFDGAMDIRVDELKELGRSMRGGEGVRDHLASQVTPLLLLLWISLLRTLVMSQTMRTCMIMGELVVDLILHLLMAILLPKVHLHLQPTKSVSMHGVVVEDSLPPQGTAHPWQRQRDPLEFAQIISLKTPKSGV